MFNHSCFPVGTQVFCKEKKERFLRKLRYKGEMSLDFWKLSDIERLIFKLTYCKGIGIAGKWKVRLLAEQLQTTSFSLETLIKVAGIRQFQAAFKKSWSEIDDQWLAEQAANQKFVSWLSVEYPSQLKHFIHYPLFLFYSGQLDLLQYPQLSFVGARQSTPYATKVLHQFIPKIVEKNFVIVSGLAKGVDRCSHEVAIYSGGSTIGVIGCGLDICYPQEVLPLFEEMKKKHLVLSEYPKGTRVQRHHFPMRNRIIAGLSQGTCVIEAKERSGSLITAQLAMEYGKEVFAIPGEIVSGQSNGCHRLIQDGAKCVCVVEDILEELPSF